MAALSPSSSQEVGFRKTLQDAPSWKILWSDDFEGDALDSKKWEAQIGSGCQYGIPGWGNNERQWYTDLPSNLRVEGGNLVLQAMLDPTARAIRDQPYTSARVRTFGKYAVRPSSAAPVIKVEARIKVPFGLGLWSAFWMLPEDDASQACSGCGRHGVWAASGEMDIMETANEARMTLGTLHYGGPWPYNSYTTNNASLPGGPSLADDFHVFSVEWEAQQIRWYLDGQLFAVQNSGAGTRGGWFSLGADASSVEAPPLPGHGPFGTQRFYIILNLALGGEGTEFTRTLNSGVPVLADQLNATLASPKAMLVDWVRVWGHSLEDSRRLRRQARHLMEAVWFAAQS